MAKEFKMPSAPSRPSSKSVNTSNLAVIAEDATAASCSSGTAMMAPSTSTKTTTATTSCLSSSLDSSEWSKYGYEGGHGKEYPRRLPDGKWAIAYDEETWEDVIVDDIEGMDPSQFSSSPAKPLGTPVQLTVGTCDIPSLGTGWEQSNQCRDVVPFEESANHGPGSGDQKFFGSGFSRPSSPARPSQNLQWPPSDQWNSYGDVAINNLTEIIPGVVGLNNLGNTCFLNSGLQCLFNTPSFVDEILLNDENSPIHPKTELNNSLGSIFISLFNKVWSKSRNESVIKPSEFKDALGQQHFQFKDYRQHDCQEFLALLLGTLHDQFNRATSNAVGPSNVSTINSTCQSRDLNDVVVNHNDTSESCPVESSTCATDSPKSGCGEDTSSVSSSSSTSGSESMDHTSSAINSHLRNQPLPPHVQPFLVPDPTGHDLNDGSTGPMDIVHSNLIPLESLLNSVSSSTTNIMSRPSSSTKICRSRTSSQSSSEVKFGQEKNEIYDRKRIESNSCDDSLVDSTELLNDKSNDGNDQEPSSSTADTRGQLFQGPITVEDLQKDLKIPNANLLIDTVNTNNKILFGSKKFPKLRDNLRNNQTVVDNLRNTYVPNDDDGDIVISSEDSQFKNNSLKRVKNDNVVSGKVMEMTCSTTNVSLSPPSSQCSSTSSSKTLMGDYECQSSSDDGQCMVNGSKKKKLDDTTLSNVEPMEVVDNHIHRGVKDVEYIDDDDGDAAWNEYLSKNQSLIVDTFQGQFKSTVRCFTCDHVSVTFEPFMYLPVPLPHALEKQVVVTFINCATTSYGNQGCPPKQYLINIHKFDRLSKVVDELKKILDTEQDIVNLKIGNQDGDRQLKLILAEVKSNHVVRILEDYVSVKFIDENNLFIFQLLASNSNQAVTNNAMVPFNGPWMRSTESIVPDDSMVTTSEDTNLIIDDNISDLGHLRPNLDPKSQTYTGSLIDDQECSSSTNNFPSIMDSWKMVDSTNECLNNYDRNKEWDQKEIDKVNGSSCIVCLEPKPKTELLQHLGCNCIICTDCLDRHSSINAIESSDQFLCPTCQIKLGKDAYATLDQPPPQVGPL